MAGAKSLGPIMAVKAINALHEPDGATARKIVKYLQMNLKNGSSITECDVALALKKAVDKGVVSAKGGKYQTVRDGASAVDGRRRRRSRSRGGRKRSRSRRRGGRRGGRSRSRRRRSRRRA